MFKNIYQILNDIDDNASLSEHIESKKSISEAYEVAYGRGTNKDTFDTLDKALDHINAGMKDRSSESFVLYNDGNEMLWIDRYTDEPGNDIGYSVSRQNDKAVIFDKQKGVAKAPLNLKFEDKWKKLVVDEIIDQTNKASLGAKFAKFNYLTDKTKPSYIDFDEKIIHCNPDETLSDTVKSLLNQFSKKTESLSSTEEENDAEYDDEMLIDLD